MNLSCDIIRDLLPLYHDGICSDDSKAMVVEHLKGCERCHEELQSIDANINVPHISPQIENSMKAASAAWKKSKKKSFFKGILIAVTICAVLIGGFVGITQWKCIPVSADVLEVTELSQLLDGSIVFHLFINDNKNLYFTKYTTTTDGCFYLTPMHSVIETTRVYDVGGFSKYHVFHPPGYDAERIASGIILPQNVKQIYVGPIGKGKLVWEEEMALPPASVEVEKIIIGK